MIAFLMRFIGAGLLVASMPLIASRFGDRTAGLILLFPIVSVSGLLVLGIERGPEAVARASLSSLLALPVVGVFLLAVYLAARQPLALTWVIAIGVTSWLTGASIFLVVSTKLGGP